MNDMNSATPRGEELLEAWDWDGGIPLGTAVPRSKAHREGIPHEAVHLWILRQTAAGPRVLFQMRAPHKENYPDCLDITVGGHVPFGLERGKAAKEAYEEIGIDIDESLLYDMGWFRFEERREGLLHREFQRVYLLRDDRPLNEYRFNDREVTGIYAVPLDAFKRLMNQDESFNVEGYDGDSSLVREVSKRDFHPQLFDPAMDLYMVVFFKAMHELALSGMAHSRLAPELGQS